MTEQKDEFTATFTHERTGETFTGIFTLKDYIQARQWLESPNSQEPAIQMAIWLLHSNLNRQSAYCAIQVWKETNKLP